MSVDSFPPLTTTPTSGADYILAAREVTPLIEEQAGLIEERARVTESVIEAMAERGLFWILVPKALGGGGVTAADAIQVIEEVAYADASTGWAFMANSIGNGIATGFLPASGTERLFAGPQKAITCGFAAPVGTAKVTPEGLLVNGRWQFGSGSHYATHIGMGVQVVDEAGEPVMLPDGSPDARFVYTPREEVTFLGNWDVTGLVGTGSVDYTVSDLIVPEELGLSTFSTTPTRGEGVYYLGLFGISVAGHAAVALGVMKRALREVARITDGKKRLGYPTDVNDYAVFQFDFSRYEAMYQAARAYTLNLYTEAEEYAAANGGLTPELAARARQVATYVHHVTHDVVSFAHLWSGTQSFRNPSRMGRVVRDANVLTQHLLIDNITLVDAAPALLDHWKSI